MALQSLGSALCVSYQKINGAERKIMGERSNGIAAQVSVFAAAPNYYYTRFFYVGEMRISYFQHISRSRKLVEFWL